MCQKFIDVLFAENQDLAKRYNNGRLVRNSPENEAKEVYCEPLSNGDNIISIAHT